MAKPNEKDKKDKRDFGFDERKVLKWIFIFFFVLVMFFLILQDHYFADVNNSK